MPFGTGWLVDVRDYFLRVPEAMIIAVIALYYLTCKLGESKKTEDDDQERLL